MASPLIDRALQILEILAANADGLTLKFFATRLAIPKSAAHRLLSEFILHGYARHTFGDRYVPTAKVLGLGYAWRSSFQVGPRVQPVLNRIAAETGELARYAAVDGDCLVWLAAAQGARFGLKVDPDQACEADLFLAAAGHAWLAFQPENEAIRLANRLLNSRRDLKPRPNAPRTTEILLQRLAGVRQRGYAAATDSVAPGIAEIAMPVRRPRDADVIGVLELCGPSIRLTETRMQELASGLAAHAAEIGISVADALHSAPRIAADPHRPERLARTRFADHERLPSAHSGDNTSVSPNGFKVRSLRPESQRSADRRHDPDERSRRAKR